MANTGPCHLRVAKTLLLNCLLLPELALSVRLSVENIDRGLACEKCLPSMIPLSAPSRWGDSGPHSSRSRPTDTDKQTTRRR